MEFQNKDLLCYERFDQGIREQIKRLLTPELIEEHRHSTVGAQSDALARVLNYVRRAPLPGKFAVYAIKPFGPYRILALSGMRGKRPEFVGDEIYASLDEVYHQIFLKRIENIK